MAARPGEDVAATLFADIHYFYSPPTAKPPHHRFDKGSYVYLFENASQRRARIEIANSAGTPGQDAFTGYLDGAHVQYSYKHSCLVTLTVDAQNSQRNSGSPVDDQQWRLPTYDPRNENKYMYKLDTIDIYFWVKENAVQFVNAVRRVLPQHQVTIHDEPTAPPAHVDDMSPVVQKLENVAITDPSYQQGQTRNSRTTTAFPGPPISATPQSQEASNFVPLAYNPAAPAAPEAIKHREKTPPPEDGAPNPLVAAAASDHGQTYGVPFQNPGGFSGPPTQPPPQQTSYFSGPPTAPIAPPPQSAPPPIASPYAQHFQNQFAPPPTASTNSSPYASVPVNLPPGPPAYSSQPQQSHIPVTQYANYPGSPGISSGMTTPGVQSPGFQSPGLSHSSTAPPGGFAQFQYQSDRGLSNTKPLMADYSIHQQIYRPTENEANMKHNKPLKQPRGKLEDRADKLEKGVGGFLKKLEKKIG